jgi:hypothetical protein
MEKRGLYLSLVLALSLLAAIPALASGSTRDGSAGWLGRFIRAQEAPTTIERDRQEHLLELAVHGNYDQCDADCYEAYKEEVNALPVDEARLFLYLNHVIQDTGSPDDEAVPTQADRERQRHVLGLVIRTLYDDSFDSQGKEVQALSATEYQLYSDFLAGIEAVMSDKVPELSDIDRLVMETKLQLAGEGQGIFDIPLDIWEAALKDAVLQQMESQGRPSVRSCDPWEATCQVVSFPYNTYKTSCSGWCISGSGFDRASNEECELLGCDYRVWFYTPEPWNGIDGNDAQGTCVANAAPHGMRWNSRSEVSCGFGTVSSCAITSGSTLAAKLRLER